MIYTGLNLDQIIQSAAEVGLQRVEHSQLQPGWEFLFLRPDPNYPTNNGRLIKDCIHGIYKAVFVRSISSDAYECISGEYCQGLNMRFSSAEPIFRLIEIVKRRHLCNVDGHVPVDTGMIRAFCKECDCDLWFDRKTAAFTIYDPFDKGKPQ